MTGADLSMVSAFFRGVPFLISFFRSPSMAADGASSISATKTGADLSKESVFFRVVP